MLIEMVTKMWDDTTFLMEILLHLSVLTPTILSNPPAQLFSLQYFIRELFLLQMFEGETSMSMLKVALITLDGIKLRGPKKFQLNQQLSHKSPRSSTATHKTNIDIILSKYDIFWADTSH